MLTKINNLPAKVLGIRASGEVTKEDMEKVLLPGLDGLAKRTGKINYLLVLENDVQDFKAGAWLDDMVAGLKHFTQWNRIAVVTAQPAVEKFTDLFELAVPGESKGFIPEELQGAIDWIGGPEPSSKPIGPKWQAIIGYALAGSLIILPFLLKFNKKAISKRH